MFYHVDNCILVPQKPTAYHVGWESINCCGRTFSHTHSNGPELISTEIAKAQAQAYFETKSAQASQRIKHREKYKCLQCGTTDTSQWRRGARGENTFCNACGLVYSKLIKNAKPGSVYFILD